MKRPLFVGAVLVCVFSVLISRFPGCVYVVGATALAFVAFLFAVRNYKLAIGILLSVIMLCNYINLQDSVNGMQELSGTKSMLKLVAIEDIKDNEYYQSLEVKTLSENGVGKNQKLCLTGDFDRCVHCGDVFYADVSFESVTNKTDRFWYYSDEHYIKARLERFDGTVSQNLFYKTAGDLRKYITKVVDTGFTSTDASLVKGVLLGDKSSMTEKQQENIRRSGVSHVVVVSGMHLAVIMTGILSFIDKMFYNRFLRCFISFAAVFAIVSLCGFTMSVIRAGIMYVIMMFSSAFRRDSDSLNALSLTVIIILSGCPYIIYNISFELSVLATLSVVTVTPYYSKLIKNRLSLSNKILCAVLDTSLVTVFATLFTMPVSVYRFGGVSLVCALTNLLISYAVTGLLLLTFTGLVFSPMEFLSVLSDMIFFVADKICAYILFVIDTLGGLKYAYIECPKWVAFIAAVIDLILFAYILCSNHFKERKLRYADTL